MFEKLSPTKTWEYAEPLWPHQEWEAEHALDPARAFYWDPRTGKTRESRLHIQRLIEERGVTRILVVAPKFVCSEVWEPELQGLPTYNYNLYDGKIADRASLMRDLIVAKKTKEAHPVVVIVNWDVLHRKDLLDLLLKWEPELVIADELHYAKSSGAARSRAIQRLGRTAKYRRGLTGTPTPKNYIDVYAQYKFLDPSIFGTNQSKFIDRYVELDYWGRPKRYRHLPELREKMFSIASRVDRRVIWKDRSPQEVVRRIILPPKARDMYDRLASEAILNYGGVEVDATHKLTQILKLQQLTAGFMQDGDQVVWVHTAKIEAAITELRDLLESNEKVVLFFHFTAEGRAFEEAIRKEFGAVVGLMDGDTPLQLRRVLQKKFLEPDSDLRIICMQDSLGIGISLKSASYCIRTSYPLDYAAFVQSNDRIYEPGKPLTYIYLDAAKTVDQFCRTVVLTKHTASHKLLDLGFEKAIRGY